jgi:MFS family permease
VSVTAAANIAAPDIADIADIDTPSSDAAAFRRILWLVGVGFFIQTICTNSGIAKLPLKLLLKNQLHLTPTALAGYLAIAATAWYCKPIVGVFADTFTIRGYRYRGYLLIASVAAALSWFATGLVPERYGPLLAMSATMSTCLVVVSTVLGGYMVMEGRRFHATGRLSAFRNTAMQATGILSGPIGGWLAAPGHPFAWATDCCAGMLALLAVYIFVSLRETPAPATAPAADRGGAAVLAKIKRQYGPLVRTRSFWAAALMTFLVMVVPGFGTPLLFYQQNTLHFDSQFLGTIDLAQSIAQIVAGFLYMFLCRKLSLRKMLAIGITVNALATVLYLFYNLRPTPQQTEANALVIDSIYGLLNMMPIIALLDLAARSTPRGGESMAYSLLMAVYNFGAQMSDVGGSWLHDHWHLTIHELVVISALTTLVTIIAVPFLPQRLVGTPDGAAVAHAAEVVGEETPDVGEAGEQ